ncbi:MAG: hypothetical protein J6P61_07100 [Erysipelotrichaceae bacterium]|nr:hypothetical protein [Erysipelotrichaceae bacterium]
MKRMTTLLIAIAIGLLMMTACGKATTEKEVSIESLETMGDAFSLNNGEQQYGYDDNDLIYVFNSDGNYYRAIADLDRETYNAIWDLDLADQKYDEKFKTIASPLKIRTIENISIYILSESDKQELIGTTGATLLDDDWTSTVFDLETKEFYMNYAYFQYKVTFEGNLRTTDVNDFDWSEDMKQLKVKSIHFVGLGNATQVNVPRYY